MPFWFLLISFPPLRALFPRLPLLSSALFLSLPPSQVLHDAFFKHQTKPKMSYVGDIYYEGKEFEVRSSRCRQQGWGRGGGGGGGQGRH